MRQFIVFLCMTACLLFSTPKATPLRFDDNIVGAQTANECHPKKGCNVCEGCCNDFIPDGLQCDKCVKAKCGCVGSSSNLPAEECSAWQRFAIAAGVGDCRADPCSCYAVDFTFLKIVNCGPGKSGTVNGTITGITLYNLGLSGTISKSITELTHLNTLALSSNSLHGTLPENIGKLKLMQELRLDYNHLSGSIPSSIKDMPDLKALTLSCNSFNNSIPKLPFKKYNECAFGGPKQKCGSPDGPWTSNQFKCPLPDGASSCQDCKSSCKS